MYMYVVYKHKHKIVDIEIYIRSVSCQVPINLQANEQLVKQLCAISSFAAQQLKEMDQNLMLSSS